MMTTVAEMADVNANLGSLLGMEGGTKKTGGVEGRRWRRGGVECALGLFCGVGGGLSGCGMIPFQSVG